MAGNSTVTRGSTGLAGVTPTFVYLNTTDSFNTLITPGYMNGIKSSGIEIEPTDFVFAVYNEGASKGLFTLTETNGIFTLQLYNPGSGQFQFTQVQFVAKGGSDLNPGNEMSFPKLTIGAAITALNLSPSNAGVVWVLDGELYEENLVLPFNVDLYAPNASIECQTGDLLTINDTGSNTLARVTCASLFANSPGKSLNLLGAQSNIFFDAQVVQGDMHIEGGCVSTSVAQINSAVHVTSTGEYAPRIINAIAYTLTFDVGATIAGNVESIMSPGLSSNDIYGGQTFLNHMIYQSPPSTETVGRSVVPADSVTTIVYNNAAGGNYTLPDTASSSIPLGTKIDFVQLGLGAVTFVAGAGVTIVSIVGAAAKTNGAGSVATAYKYTDTIWIVSGDIVIAP